MLAIVGQVRVYFVAAALVILGAVRLPVTKADPAEVMSACATLHVIAAAILLYADLALGTVLQVRVKDTYFLNSD